MKFLLSIFLIQSAVLLLTSIDTGIGAIIIAITSGITTMVVAWIGYKVAKLNVKADKLDTKVEEYHKEVNGKMTQLLDVTAQAGKAEGKLEGRKEKQEETDAKGS